MAASDASVFPARGAAYRLYFTVRDITGAVVTGWTSPSARVSKDGGAHAASTNTPAEISSSMGCGYLDLTASEMDADNVTVKLSVTNSDANDTVVTIFTGGLAEIAGALLTNASNKLLTNGSGQVECSNLEDISVDVSSEIAEAVWETADYGDEAGRGTLTVQKQIAQIWRYLFNKNRIARADGTHIVYKDDDSTAMMTGFVSMTDSHGNSNKKT